MAKNVGKLRDKASKLVNKGKYAKALEVYQELEQVEPASGDWARRAADMHRRLDEDDREVAALERAADKYARAGFLVKAIAVCKMILQDRPDHDAALARLAELQSERGMPVGRRPPTAPPVEAAAPEPAAPPPPAAAPPPPAAAPPPPAKPDGADKVWQLDLEEDTPLDAVSLGSLIPDAVDHKPTDSGAHSGITLIPLDDDDLELIDDLELVVDEDATAADAEARQAAAGRVEQTPLFSALGAAALQQMVDEMDLIEVDAGAALFHQGDRGNTLYVVVEGEVAVISEGPPRVQLSTLGEGEFFGEIALVTEQPRSATIEATEDTQLLAIDRDVIRSVLASEPAALKVMLRFLRNRLLDNLVKTSPLFQPFQGAERTELATKFGFLEAEADSVLIHQGDRSEGLYVLLSGHAEVILDQDGKSRRLATLGSGDIFGEMSLLGNTPAIATVRATGKCFILEMPADEFRTTIMTHPQVLMVVGELAEERQRQFDAISRGEADYDEGHLELV
jgi:CRP-like cAMP-binding protein